MIALVTPYRAALPAVLAGMVLLLGASAGCGKRQPPPAPPTAATNAVPAAATPAPETVDLTQMTRDLRRWIVRNQRPPKDYAEFAATAGNPYPAPPAGKKFAIDKSMHVVLVNR